MLAKILSYFEKIRIWGIKGILDHFKAIYADKRLQKELSGCLKNSQAQPERGISIIAPMSGAYSLSKVMRDLAFNLRDSNIPFQTYDTSPENQVHPDDILPILTPRNNFDLLKYDHILLLFDTPLPSNLPIKKAHVIFWEFESGLLEYNPKLGNIKEVVAMSDFNINIFRQTFPPGTSVRKILYPFRTESVCLKDLRDVRTKYGIGENDFMVFYNFDFGSSYYRKNPESALKAFALAFKGQSSVRLVFKTQSSTKHADKLKRLMDLAGQLGIRQSFLTINDYIPQHDIYSLTNTCDVYISLHRGEGFGLGIAEAMSLGKAVIVTNYSAPKEFCNHHNAILIPYHKMAVPANQVDNQCYRFVKEWAEPDINAAAVALVKLRQDPSYRKQLGDEAKRTIHDKYSLKNFSASINDFLSD